MTVNYWMIHNDSFTGGVSTSTGSGRRKRQRTSCIRTIGSCFLVVLPHEPEDCGCRNDPVPRAQGGKRMITTRSAAALAAAAFLAVLAAGCASHGNAPGAGATRPPGT